MRINHVIRTLIVSDFLTNAGFAIFAPIFAIFVTKQIDGGSVEVVGFAAALTQLFKVTLQIPIAKYLDRNHGEYDDFYSLILGSFLAALVPFLYFFATTATHVYIIQSLYGVSLALAVPPWYAIFTRHIDKMRENIEWSFDSVSIGVSAAAAAAIGGVLAERIGFRSLFLIGGVLAIIGGICTTMIFHDLKRRVSQGAVKPLPDRASS